MTPPDHGPERRGAESARWARRDPDVLPMWADGIDVAVAPPILEALRGRIGIDPGPCFGAPRFARLNSGCPRATLREGIDRIAACLAG